MNEQRIGELLGKYRNGECSASERWELLQWYRSQALEEGYFPDEEQQVEQRMLARLKQAIAPKQKANFSGYWIAYAAAILIIGLITLLFSPKAKQNLVVKQQPVIEKILPGGNKAILTIGGGKPIVLTDRKNGLVARENNVAVTKAADGQLTYQAAAGATTNVVSNTLATPRGGEYQVVLPDGSKVWLNAASSITYPSAFSGKDRLVRLSGEAYFEVAKNPDRPFKVNVDGKQTVEVLGTHFNINAYPDDHNIRTTLLEGSVKLICKDQETLLRPGQTAVNDGEKPLLIQKADLEEVMAWRNGLMLFHGQNLEYVMNKISRWYDVDVEVQDKVKNRVFGGTLTKYKDINAFLDILKLSSGVHYQIKGRRVIIME